MTAFTGTIYAQRRLGLHVQGGRPVPSQSLNRMLLIADNDHGTPGTPDCDGTMAQSIRELIRKHGVHAAQHMATLAQAAFWRGDMDRYRECLNIHKQLNRVISAQPISQKKGSTPYFV